MGKKFVIGSVIVLIIDAAKIKYLQTVCFLLKANHDFGMFYKYYFLKYGFDRF